MPHLFGTHEYLKVGSAKLAVPVVCDVSSIHDLTKQVAQVSPWNLKHRSISD